MHNKYLLRSRSYNLLVQLWQILLFLPLLYYENCEILEWRHWTPFYKYYSVKYCSRWLILYQTKVSLYFVLFYVQYSSHKICNKISNYTWKITNCQKYVDLYFNKDEGFWGFVKLCDLISRITIKVEVIFIGKLNMYVLFFSDKLSFYFLTYLFLKDSQSCVDQND